ncbi:MAG: hypothetical protein RMM07_11905 [Anaerolineae bacterium]|nr:hypothetical protein [Anaerolineae bacterium]
MRRRPDWAGRLVLVDPAWDRAVPLNLFCAPESIWAINTLLTAGRRIWEGYWGPRMSGVLEAAAMILWSYNRQVPEEMRLSFRHVPYVLFNVRLRREELMRGLPPADLPQAVLLDLQLGQAAEAARSPLGWQVEVASPIVSKVIALNHPWLRAALAAPRMADMERWIAERRWVIVSLPAGAMGEGNAELIAAWFYNLWEWAFRRAGTERPHPRSFCWTRSTGLPPAWISPAPWRRSANTGAFPSWPASPSRCCPSGRRRGSFPRPCWAMPGPWWCSGRIPRIFRCWNEL